MTLKELMMVTDESLSIAVSGVEEEVAKMNIWTCPEDVAEQDYSEAYDVAEVGTYVIPKSEEICLYVKVVKNGN